MTLFYNLDQKTTLSLRTLRDLHQMSRPLSIAMVEQNLIAISFDDGNVVVVALTCVQNDVTLTGFTVYWPCDESQKQIRLPTATSICCISHQEQWKTIPQKYLYLGSQSIDTIIVQVQKQSEMYVSKIVQDRFNCCFGAIQDFCLLNHGRVFVSTSQGRDGSIL